ncbi:MAG: hypothetical protein LIO77_05160 [Rikenellaceae bacterium]|nr:hypothetical protein [Rikenellaceae bacterium]
MKTQMACAFRTACIPASIPVIRGGLPGLTGITAQLRVMGKIAGAVNFKTVEQIYARCPEGIMVVVRHCRSELRQSANRHKKPEQDIFLQLPHEPTQIYDYSAAFMPAGGKNMNL